MRNSPTPSAGVSRAARAAAPSCTFARIATACPSAVAPGPLQRAASSASRRAAATASAAPSCVRRHGDGARGAVDKHHGADADRVEPVDGDHAGDAELAGDDRGVAGRAAERGGQRNDQASGSSPAVSAGARSSASRIDGHGGQRDARLGQAAEFGDHAVADVAKIGDPLGHQTAELCEEVDELVDGGHHRAHGGGPCVDVLLGGAQPGPVLRQRGRRGQHLGRHAGRVRGPVAQPGGDRSGRGGEARRLGGTVRLVDLGRRRPRRRAPAAGPAGSPGRTERLRRRGRRAGRCRAAGRRTRCAAAVTWARMRRSCESDYKPTVDKSTHSGVKQHISTFIRVQSHTNGAPCTPKSVSKRSPRW